MKILVKLNELFDRREKWEFALVMAAVLLMAFWQAVGIAAVAYFINLLMNSDIIFSNRWLSLAFDRYQFETVNSFIVASGLGVLGLLVVGNMISVGATWLRIRFAWKKNHRLSCDLLAKYLVMPYRFFLNQNTSDLGKNILAEVLELTSNFLLPLMQFIAGCIVAVVILGLLFLVNPQLTVVGGVILASLYYAIYLFFAGELKKSGKQSLEKNKQRFQSATEALGGIKDIKVLGVEKFFWKRFQASSGDFSRLQGWYQVIGHVPSYIMEIVAFGGVIGMTVYLVAAGVPMQRIIPLVSFYAFAGFRLMPALQGVFGAAAVLKFNTAILNKVHHDLTYRGLIRSDKFDQPTRVERLPLTDAIYMQNVSFSYPGHGRAALKNINMTIRKNSSVALIGPTGSGKSTLVDLMLGLLEPSAGSIKIDNVTVDERTVRNWQANLGYVPQHIYLSDDTVKRNIAFGLADNIIVIDQVVKAAKMAGLHEFVCNDLPDGYDQMIGERGVRLSGGQRQRIGIARALYHDPQVLLFDEATSALDTVTEKEVLEAIERVAKTKTMIIVAHRLTTVKDCDVVHVVERGEIARSGSWAQMTR